MTVLATPAAATPPTSTAADPPVACRHHAELAAAPAPAAPSAASATRRRRRSRPHRPRQPRRPRPTPRQPLPQWPRADSRRPRLPPPHASAPPAAADPTLAPTPRHTSPGACVGSLSALAVHRSGGAMLACLMPLPCVCLVMLAGSASGHRDRAGRPRDFAHSWHGRVASVALTQAGDLQTALPTGSCPVPNEAALSSPEPRSSSRSAFQVRFSVNPPCPDPTSPARVASPSRSHSTPLRRPPRRRTGPTPAATRSAMA